jgi:DNA-directed RNA polymerase II subunit RPB2
MGAAGLTNYNRDNQPQRKQRLKYARDVLRENLLPHVGIKHGDEFKKAFFAGYMTNRLIQAHLGRTTEDDRDYYGKKRLDMAGGLINMIFQQEFRKVIKEMEQRINKEVNNARRRDRTNEQIKLDKLENYFKSETISAGLKRALSTGNWGKDKDNNVLKTGVS